MYFFKKKKEKKKKKKSEFETKLCLFSLHWAPSEGPEGTRHPARVLFSTTPLPGKPGAHTASPSKHGILGLHNKFLPCKTWGFISAQESKSSNPGGRRIQIQTSHAAIQRLTTESPKLLKNIIMVFAENNIPTW